MIAYFSGTGNTEWVAAQLSTLVCDNQLVHIPVSGTIDFNKVDSLGICFPVHAWGVPSVVTRFIQSIPRDCSIPYIYMVCTCGDDSGLTMYEFKELLECQNQRVSLYYSLQMPNTYVNLPGFDVDSLSVQHSKVTHALQKLQVLSKHVQNRDEVVDVVKGNFPWLKSRVLRPLFNRYLVKDHFFHVSDSCIKCGTCEKVCPVQNIQFQGKPIWLHQGDCLSCMACYHSCPEHAITFGKYTDHKGQYLFKKLKF